MRNSSCIKSKWMTFKSILPSPLILLQKRKQNKKQQQQIQEYQEKNLNQYDQQQQDERRSSHSNSCCSSSKQQQQYNLIDNNNNNNNNNNYLFFKRRSSSCSEMSVADLQREAEKLYDLFLLALDELNYAGDSQGTFYYINDRVSAKEAIENFTNASMQLLNQAHDPQFKSQLHDLIYPRLYLLQNKFDALPDDPKPTHSYYSSL